MKRQIELHLQNLKKCKMCPNMVGPVVTHSPVLSKVYLLAQAPGPHEGKFGRPFAWTAGKTLFRWFSSIGIDEQQFRNLTYMGAVCRCFPGKAAGGGDRVPSEHEISACSSWIEREFKILQPELVIPVGKLAIEQIFEKALLTEIVGQQFNISIYGKKCDVIPLPHPSGASTWFKREPGKSLLAEALQLLSKHSQWQHLIACSTN
jgi:Uracil-DNA glycosylase